MKSTSWKKNHVVVMYSDYDNVWEERTIPCTLLQAARFISAKHWNHYEVKGTVRIVTLAELQALATVLQVVTTV